MKKSRGFSTTGIIGIVAIVAFIIIAGYLVIDGNNKATDYSKYNFATFIDADEHTGNIADHIKGYDIVTGEVTDDKEKIVEEPVIIVEYADFQCSYCAMMNPRINNLIKDLEGDLAVVYRNYLLSYHQNGTAAASAAEAAGLQGYWKPYADKLFAEQEEWFYASGASRTELFKKYFAEVTDNQGDLDKFEKDLSSPEVSKRISFDMGIGKRIDISGTPAFYVDGQFIDFSNAEGGKVVVNGKTIEWTEKLSGDKFNDVIKQIVETKKSTE